VSHRLQSAAVLKLSLHLLERNNLRRRTAATQRLASAEQASARAERQHIAPIAGSIIASADTRASVPEFSPTPPRRVGTERTRPTPHPEWTDERLTQETRPTNGSGQTLKAAGQTLARAGGHAQSRGAGRNHMNGNMSATDTIPVALSLRPVGDLITSSSNRAPCTFGSASVSASIVPRNRATRLRIVACA